MRKIDRAGLLEAARREIVDEQGRIAGSRKAALDLGAIGWQAEAAMQQDDCREGAGAGGFYEVAAERLAGGGRGRPRARQRGRGRRGRAARAAALALPFSRKARRETGVCRRPMREKVAAPSAAG